MKPEDFNYLSKMLKERSGLIVSAEKVYLLESRLTPVARRHDIDGLDGLIAKLRMSLSNSDLCKEVIEAMTTNESFFFRDRTPFDSLKKYVLPYLHKTRSTKKRLRIWCAAASSGQEPYSIAMILKEESAKWAGWNIEIVATDICTKVLDKAKKGIYSQFEVQRGLPIQMMMKYFEQKGELWQISDEIRRMVKYNYLNLLEPINQLGTFDVVFCRNVLIYFDQQTKGEVLNRQIKQMQNDAVLYLGAAETVLGISNEFKPVRGQRGMYVSKQADGTLYTPTEL